MMTDPTDPTSLLVDDGSDDFDDAMDDDGSDESDEDDFGNAFEEPAIIVGILRMHVSGCKENPKNPKQIILELTSEDKETRQQTMTSWFDTTKGFNNKNFKRIVRALGGTIKERGRQWIVAGGLSSLKNLSGTFVVHTWGGEDPNSDIAQGVPKSEKSKEWKAWLAANPLSPAQLAVLKDCCGVIPKEHEHLFDKSISAEDEDL